MEHLRQSELKTLLNFLHSCYALQKVDSYEQFLRHLVSSLTQLIPAQAAFYLEVDQRKSSSYHVGSQPYIEAPEAVAAWEQNMHEHAPLLHIQRTGDISARRTSDFWSERRFHDSGIYCNVFRRYSVEDDLGVTLSPGPPLIGIGWHGDRRFTGSERLLADLAAPHINQAWQNAKLASGIHHQLQLLKQGVESAGLAAIGCDPDGRVRFNTPLARRYLAEYFDVSKNLDRQLPDELRRWMQHQIAQIHKNDVPPVRLPLAVDKGNKCLTVRLLSNNGTNLLLLEEKSPPPNADLLSSRGLSPRESEVLAWVSQGKTNGEISDILGMNLGTVKKHLVNIFQKLGVETRTAAAALALTSHSPSGQGGK